MRDTISLIAETLLSGARVPPFHTPLNPAPPPLQTPLNPPGLELNMLSMGESGGGGEFLGCVAQRAGAHTSAQRVTRGEGRAEESQEGRGEGGGGKGHSVLHCDTEGIMHALKEQQRLSFEQHAHVLAVLQEQGRQLQGLLIDRDNRDKQELENAMLKESIAVLDTETAKLERCMRQSGIFKEQQELAHATESLFLARARSLSHVNNRQTLQY